jgi:hypothetical protein
MVFEEKWKIINASGGPRIIVTRDLPGSGWYKILSEAGYRTEIWAEESSLPRKELIEKMGTGCRAVIGQLTERCDRSRSNRLGLCKDDGKSFSDGLDISWSQT